MRFLNLVSLLPVLASVCHSSILEPRVPAGSPNGIYTFQPSPSEDGTWNLTTIPGYPLKSGTAPRTVTHPIPIGPASAPRGKTTKHLSKRAYWGSTGHTIASAKDLKDATMMWKDFFISGQEVDKRSVTVFIVNDAQIAACNYKHYEGSGVVHWWLVDDFNGIMDDTYGPLSTGWVHYDDSFDWSFWRDVPGTIYCDNLHGNYK
ncbi:hypothetical protein V8F06_002240 [Rhypophila decipiens]